MPIAIDPSVTFDYVMKEDRKLPKAEQTVFQLRILSYKEFFDIQGLVTNLTGDDEEDDMATLARARDSFLAATQKVLKGWKNYKFSDGREADFDAMSKELFPCFSFDQLKELFHAALNENTLTEEEEGNSSSSPDSPTEVSSKGTETAA